MGVAAVGLAAVVPTAPASAEWQFAVGYGCNNIAWEASTRGNSPSAGLKTVKTVHEQESVGSEVWWLPPCAAFVCNTAGGGAVIYANGNYGFQTVSSTHSGCGLYRSVSQNWGGSIDPMSATYRLKWRSDATGQAWWSRDHSGL